MDRPLPRRRSIAEILGKAPSASSSSRTTISGQFARYLRSETGIAAHGHIRKYDGEPFMPHHIVDGVQEQLAGQTQRSVPYRKIMV